MTKKTKIVLGIAAAVVAVAAVAGGLVLGAEAPEVMTENASNQALTVTTMASGEVVTGTKVDVYAGTQGIVASVEVEDGQAVKKGDVLATLETDGAEMQLAQARSGLSQAQSALAQAKAGKTSAAAGLTAARASLSAAKTGLASARSSYAMSQTAVATAEATIAALNPATQPVEYAAAQAALAQAKGSLEQANAAVAQAKAGVAQAEAGLAQAKAGTAASAGVTAAQDAVAAARKGVDVARKALADTTITAPADGVVTVVQDAAVASAAAAGQSAGISELSAGSVVAPGSPVFTIYNPDALSFSATVDESEAGGIEVGQNATVTLNAFPGETFTGKVTSVGSKAAMTLTGGTVFPIEVALEDSDLAVKVGMKGDVDIELAVQQNALVVPIGALFSEGSNDYIFVMGDDFVLAKTAVVIGTMTDQQVEIIEGIAAGDTVALAGDVTLLDGMKITPAIASSN